ncbi:nuclear transport factor 2 family protein [Halomarina ordinaria]|uniref:Nuclear transport factor 2 family protein n=1 Tax=Halomarina ordinaria TaxID=3033939 RepID=A0ABD5U8L5_9EURY|nr:nuclear transport factor 2 family protein [Halomarina sp. PSRA2]
MGTTDDTTEEVLDRHLEAFGAQDMDAILADYDEDAVVVAQLETYRGLDEIEELFAGLFEEFDDPDVTFSLDESLVEDEYGHIVWRASTPETEYEFATDTFVIRDGNIVAQTFVAKTSDAA